MDSGAATTPRLDALRGYNDALCSASQRTAVNGSRILGFRLLRSPFGLRSPAIVLRRRPDYDDHRLVDRRITPNDPTTTGRRPRGACHVSMPRQHATSACHTNMPRQYATSACHASVHRQHATSACHVSMPHPHATSSSTTRRRINRRDPTVDKVVVASGRSRIAGERRPTGYAQLAIFFSFFFKKNYFR